MNVSHPYASNTPECSQLSVSLFLLKGLLNRARCELVVHYILAMVHFHQPDEADRSHVPHVVVARQDPNPQPERCKELRYVALWSFSNPSVRILLHRSDTTCHTPHEAKTRPMIAQAVRGITEYGNVIMSYR
jgi:hypothetical protein